MWEKRLGKERRKGSGNRRAFASLWRGARAGGRGKGKRGPASGLIIVWAKRLGKERRKGGGNAELSRTFGAGPERAAGGKESGNRRAFASLWHGARAGRQGERKAGTASLSLSVLPTRSQGPWAVHTRRIAAGSQAGSRAATTSPIRWQRRPNSAASSWRTEPSHSERCRSRPWAHHRSCASLGCPRVGSPAGES